MRARTWARSLAITPLLAFGALALEACEGVPDLRFADSEDAAPSSPASTLDATVIAFDVSPGTGSGSGGGSSSGGQDANVATGDDAGGGGTDSAPPPSDSGTTPAVGCPNHPPDGVTCCGTIECKGTAAQCNCNSCSICASQGVCCPMSFMRCASSLNACH